MNVFNSELFPPLNLKYLLKGKEIFLRFCCRSVFFFCFFFPWVRNSAMWVTHISFFKNCVHWSIKIIINNPLLDAQNAGNCISELLNFNSRLIYLQQPLVKQLIETPAIYYYFLHSKVTLILTLYANKANYI